MVRESFPASKLVRVADGLENFVEIFEHYQFALHAHFATVDIFEKPSRTLYQLFLQPFVLYDVPDFAEHDLI